MLSVKNELLLALTAALENISAGSGAKAAFESPKVAAHGDLATTAAIFCLGAGEATIESASTLLSSGAVSPSSSPVTC